jgi:hypothetical protein
VEREQGGAREALHSPAHERGGRIGPRKPPRHFSTLLSIDRIPKERKGNAPGGGGIRMNTTDDPSGASTLNGTRLKVLALLAVAGDLELTVAGPAVRAAAEAALEQRQARYDTRELTCSCLSYRSKATLDGDSMPDASHLGPSRCNRLYGAISSH